MISLSRQEWRRIQVGQTVKRRKLDDAKLLWYSFAVSHARRRKLTPKPVTPKAVGPHIYCFKSCDSPRPFI